jgi:hypothetical protein
LWLKRLKTYFWWCSSPAAAWPAVGLLSAPQSGAARPQSA